MIISVINQKGGVGKTTTVQNLSVGLAKEGLKILVVDTDPQSNLTSSLGYTHSGESISIYELLVNPNLMARDVIQSTKWGNLSLIPSNIQLAGAEIELVSAFSREGILKKKLEQIESQFDLILVDCPPSLGILTVNSLVASKYILIPVQAEYFALEGLGQLINTYNLIKTNLNPELEILGVILTMFDSRTNLSKDVMKELEKFFHSKLFSTIIPRNVRLSEAPSRGESIFEYAPNSVGALTYKHLVEEIVSKLKIIKN